jgi:uncharacterized protein
MEHSNPQIMTDQLPSIEDVIFEKAHPKSRINDYIVLAIIAIILLSTYMVIAFFVEDTLFEMPWIGFAILGFTAILGMWIWLINRDYQYTGFALRSHDIIYKTGVLFRSTAVVPFNRVQHCELNQGPISRYLKLNSLTIYTAGGSSSDISIDGLTVETAQRLKQYISGKIAVDEEE